MEGFWPIFFLAVILKIPIAGLLYLVWWAIHQTPETEEAPPAARMTSSVTAAGDPAARAARAGGPTPRTRSRCPSCPPGGRFRVLTPPAPARAATAHAGLGTLERLRAA